MDSLLDIIIVNWNSAQHLRECLKSIMITNKDGFELSQVVVVDNASSDDSMNALEHIDLPLTIIRNEENRGFAAASNQGAKGSTADYLLFLNPDTRLFADTLYKPIVFMQKPENSRVGICGVQLITEQGRVSRSCAYFPTPKLFFSKMLGLYLLFPKTFPTYLMEEWDHADNRVVDHVMGAFYLVRHKIFESLGGFDERFLVYLEDLDFSYRAHKAGWSSYYVAEAQIFHKGGGASEKVKATRLFYSLRSRIIYVGKHFSLPSAAVVVLITMFVEPVIRMAYVAMCRSLAQIGEIIRAYIMLWHAIPETVRALISPNSKGSRYL